MVGLPGSGKSYYIGKWLEKQTGHWYCFEDWTPTEQRYNVSVDIMGEHENMLIASVELCRREVLQKMRGMMEAAYPGIRVEVIYFENDVRQCIKNVIARSYEKGDVFNPLNNGYTQMVGGIHPPSGNPGFIYDIDKIKELWHVYHIDRNEKVLPVYCKK